jgi:hypothetical protein
MFGKTAVESPKLDKLMEESSKSPLSFPALVGSKEYADVVFHVGSHAIYAHRCVLESRCPPLFNVAIKDKGKKGHLQTIKSDEKLVDTRSLTLVLEYLYTGSVPFAEIAPAEVISLIAHAELYQIDRLRWLCERYLQSVMNNDLFFSLLLVSDVSGVVRAKKMCLSYGALHFEELIQRKEQVHTLGIELFREFVVHATLNHDVVEDLSQLTFPNTIREEFKIIYTAMALPDAFFVFKAANTTIPCHKAILYAQSERFKTLFLEDGPSAADNRYNLPKNIMMPQEAFKSFLAWTYYRDTSFSAAHAAMILPLAHDFGMDALIEECSAKLRKGISVDSVLPILVLCFSEWGKKGYKAELAQPCLDFLILHFADVDLSGVKSSAIASAVANAVRNAVTTGIWSTIGGSTSLASSAPISAATASVAANEENASSAPAAVEANGTASNHHHSHSHSHSNHGDEEASDADGQRSARRKKRRTMQISMDTASEEASGSLPTTPHDSKRKSKHTSQAEPAAPEPEKEPAQETAEAVVAAATVTAAAVAEESKAKPTEEKAPVVTAQAPTEEVKTEPVEEKPAVEAPVEAPVAEVKETKPAEPEKAALASSSEVKVTTGNPKQTTVKSDSKPRVAAAPASPSTTKRTKATTASPAATPSAPAAKPEKEGKAEKTAAPASEATELPVSPSTKERRATLEPSTSVKAIKETFEAKGREESEKEQAADKVRAGRRKANAEDGKPEPTSKKEGKSK